MRRNWWGICLVAAAIFAVAIFGWNITHQIHLQRNQRVVDENMSMVAQSLQGRFTGVKTLLDILREDPLVLNTLKSPGTSNVERLIAHLNTIGERTGLHQIFVVNDEGVAVASSNWNSRNPLPSINLAERVYFTNAMKHGRSLLFTFTHPVGLPGIYASRKVNLSSGKSGVVVAKVEPGPLESAWRKLESHIALADRNGIIFMTNHEDWRFRPLRPLSAGDLAAIERNRLYSNIDFSKRQPLFDNDVEIDRGVVAIAGNPFIIHTQTPDGLEWKVIVANPIVMPYLAANVIALLIVLIGVIISSGAYIYRQRGMLIRLKNEQSVLLERKVEERTRELAIEMENRRRTEENLHNAEQDLVQAAKLAALGQMSAALAHEVSQPVIALAATLTAAERWLDAAEVANARKLVERAQNLTYRIQHIIRHLRSFSKKEPGAGKKMDIANSIRASLELAETRAREIGVTIEAVGLDQKAEVFGSPIRLEQVLINILLNALDAVAGQDRREVGISLVINKQMAHVEVWDTGPGIPDGFGDKLSEPFFTTKTGEEGLGLGLSISQLILEDFGASMRFTSRKGGGTVCKVFLPLARQKEKVEAAE